MERSAVISPDGLYRYRLDRDWRAPLLGEKQVRFAYGMLNPSTADGIDDDHTVTKLIGFTKRLGGNCFTVFNAYAWRATDPKALLAAYDAYIEKRGPSPTGGEHAELHIKDVVKGAERVVIGWGKPPAARLAVRFGEVMGILDDAGWPLARLACFGMTREGYPRHPLMLGYEQTPLVSVTTGERV